MPVGAAALRNAPMTFTDILYGVEERLAITRLNRPNSLNAVTPGILGEVVEAFDRAATDENDTGGHVDRRRTRFQPGCRPVLTPARIFRSPARGEDSGAPK